MYQIYADEPGLTPACENSMLLKLFSEPGVEGVLFNTQVSWSCYIWVIEKFISCRDAGNAGCSTRPMYILLALLKHLISFNGG